LNDTVLELKRWQVLGLSYHFGLGLELELPLGIGIEFVVGMSISKQNKQGCLRRSIV